MTSAPGNAGARRVGSWAAGYPESFALEAYAGLRDNQPGVRRMRMSHANTSKPQARRESASTWRLLLCALRWVVGASVFVVCTPASAHAQSDIDADIERFSPATSNDGFLGLDATRTPGPGQFALGLMAGFEAQPLRMPPQTQSPLGRIDLRTTTWVTGEVGVGGRLALSAVLLAYPYQHVVPAAGNTLPSRDLGMTIGDTRLSARYRLIGESSDKADAPRDGPGLALQASAFVPTSGGTWFAGERAVRAELALLADFQLLGAGIGASVGFRPRFENPTLARYRVLPGSSVRSPDPLELGHELTFAAALALPLPPAPKLAMLLEVRGATDFQSALTTSLELELGARAHVGDFAITLGGGVGLTQGLGTPDGRLLLGLRFAPPDTDSDADGVPDDADKCPMLAEDRDGFGDGDGCPDPDNDNDLVPDVDDLCPNLEAIEGKDDNEDGCTDGTKPTKRGP